MNDTNVVLVSGVLERAPYTKTSDNGATLVGFSLKVTETNPATGVSFKTYVSMEAYGSVAAVARDLSVDDACLVEGKLKFQTYTAKTGEKKSGLAILARAIRVLQPAEVPA